MRQNKICGLRTFVWDSLQKTLYSNGAGLSISYGGRAMSDCIVLRLAIGSDVSRLQSQAICISLGKAVVFPCPSPTLKPT